MIGERLSPLHIEDGFAWGWVAMPDRLAQPATVHLYVDGHRRATELTGITLPVGARKACGPPPHQHAGYAFALPASVSDGFAHDLQVLLAHVGQTDDVFGPVTRLPAASVCGEVAQRGSHFTGTVWFRQRPKGKSVLSIADLHGGLQYSPVLDVAKAPGERGYAGQFSVPCALLTDEPLVFSCKGQVLRGSPCRQRPHVTGKLNSGPDGHLHGWALDASDVRRPLELVLRVDGQTVEYFRPNVPRPDINTYLNLPPDGLGLAGFSMAPPQILADGRPHLVEVVSAIDGQALTDRPLQVQLSKAGIAWDDLQHPQANAASKPMPVAAPAWPIPVVSLVILNRNGATVLEAFLRSWAEHNRCVAAEIIVVDHASRDESLAMLEPWRRRLDVRVLPLDHNDSFSASCNLAAEQARAPYLLFMNNDIVWQQDALPRMLETLQDPQVGIVGIKLHKAVGSARAQTPMTTEVQHLGVRFKLNGSGYWPFEASPSALQQEGEHCPQYVPAVTGAVLLCRTSDFRAIGGFDTAYFYGFEDVEFCLRLAYRLRKTVVCRNDCLALHRHGHTRLSGREMSVFDRVQRNSHVLESQMGVWLKQAYWRSLVTGDGYMTREPLTIGLVVDAMPKTSDNTPLTAEMLELGHNIRSAMPHARLVLMPPEREWKNVHQLHVLVVGDSRYDIRSVQKARPDLLPVAWVAQAPAKWQKLPWWDSFGAILTPAHALSRVAKSTHGVVHASSAPMPLGQCLTNGRWRLRVAIEGHGKHARQAETIRQRLRAQGVPCWILQQGDAARPAAMADVCISVTGRASAAIAGQQDASVLYLQWEKGLPVGSEVAWLDSAMEACVGRTFHSP